MCPATVAPSSTSASAAPRAPAAAPPTAGAPAGPPGPRPPPLPPRFAGGGRFGSGLLFTRVEGDRQPLTRLAASVTAAARRSRIPVDDRPYRPHLTLARGRGDEDLRPAAARLETFTGLWWTARSLDLVG